MTPLRILQDLARAQGNPALPLMVPDAVRALVAADRKSGEGRGYVWTEHLEMFARVNARIAIRLLATGGAIELRPDAGNALSPADLALCPRGARGVPLVTLVVREVLCPGCGKPFAWDGVDACSSCLEAT